MGDPPSIHCLLLSSEEDGTDETVLSEYRHALLDVMKLNRSESQN